MQKVTTWMKGYPDKKLHGVLSGFALWMGWNVILVRIAYILMLLVPLFFPPYDQITFALIISYFAISGWVLHNYKDSDKINSTEDDT